MKGPLIAVGAFFVIYAVIIYGAQRIHARTRLRHARDVVLIDPHHFADEPTAVLYDQDDGGGVMVAVVATVAGLALIAGIIIGGYQLHWWLRGQEVNRSARINRQSYEVQQTYREKVLADMRDVSALDSQIADPAYADSAAQLRAQRIAAIRTTCDHIARLTTSGAGVDPDIQEFHDKECIG